MKRLTFLLAAATWLCACSTGPQNAAVNNAPHLEKRGQVTQLIVDGKPYLALACELKNSSSTSRAYMAPVWEKLKGTGINTVIGSVSWEQIEPEESRYDFTAVDDMVKGARECGVKLIFIWFGSWKNGISSYQPMWMKQQPERYFPAETADGVQLPILSTLCQAAREADARAFAATMAHIRDIDSEEHTVIMMQVENEVGLHGSTRDFCEAALTAFASEVPAELTSYLSAHASVLLGETAEVWKAAGSKTSGSWSEVFGEGDAADEYFMAWNYASYVDAVAAAGKAQYDLPMFVNAWIVQPSDRHPGDYPSGGPQAQCHDIWRAAAPHIDFLSPDIYLSDYPDILRRYARGGNPVFVPESKDGLFGAANAAFTFGEMGGFGYSPFGLDASIDAERNQPFYEFYRCIGSMSDQVLEAQAEGRITAVWLKGSKPIVFRDKRLMGDWELCFDLVSSGGRNGGAPTLLGGIYDVDKAGYAIVIADDEDSFTLLGANIRVSFRTADRQGMAVLGRVFEGRYEDGEWIPGRMLNGDEIQLRYDLVPAAAQGFTGQGLNFATDHPEIIKADLIRN